MPSINTVDPATGKPLATYPAHGWDEIDSVLDQAAGAFTTWSSTSVEQRGDLLRRVGALLTERRERYAALITAEMGKPLAEARGEIDKCAWTCGIVADHAADWLGDHEVASAAARSWVAYEPLGVVFAVMPWNFPFWQVLRFACAALAAGDAAVLKHAPNVTGCALAVETLFADAGAPRGLFRSVLVADDDVTDLVPRIIADDRVVAVTHTGSERAGAAVGAAAGAALKKSVLELGGSDPFVVLDDADLPAAAEAAARSRFGNAGQSCIAAKRFIVADAIADEFT
ncbi:aldehyde dehydrogenase family protein, partial [Streptomyces neyagawaensis]